MGHSAVGIASPTDASKVAEVATVAAADSGQAAMLVRVVSTNAAGSGGGPATIADGADVAEGATTDAAVVTNTTGTISGKLRGLVAWAYTRMPAALGQTTMTASLPVVIASDQSALTVASHAVTNAGTFAVQAAATLAAETTKVIGTVNQGTSPWVSNDPGLPDTLGQKTMANSTGVVLASDQASVPVAATLTAETTKVIGTINVASAQTIGLAAGSAVVGHVIADASSAVIGHVIVDTAPSTAVTNAGTFAVQATLAAETTKVIGTVNIAAAQTIATTQASPGTLVSFITANVSAGTRVQLGSNAITQGILQAPSTNTGNIYVGGSTVSATVFGAELQPGQATGIALTNTNLLYFDAATSGDKIAFLGG